MKVTRIIQARTPEGIEAILKPIAFMRADIWRRFGALGNVGKSAATIRKEITAGGWYAGLNVDGTIRAETTKDVVNDILTYKEAAKKKVKKAIAARTSDKVERKRLYTLLRRDEWLQDSFLHRRMRKHFRHGVAKADNQFIVRSDKFATSIEDDRLVVTIKIAKKFGNDFNLVTTTNGNNVNLTGSNLRIIVKDSHIEIHYSPEKPKGRPHGEQAIGIDKGYTEAFTDSDGKHHGQGFGRVLTEYSNKVASKGKQRNKLHALENKHRTKGNYDKANRIKINNLGRKKIEARKAKAQKSLRTIAFKSAHAIIDKAALVVSEDLTQPINKKQQGKGFNRRMSNWAKGILAEAVESVCKQREAEHVLVNSAYTSQMDSQTGLLQGKRVGDKFYCASGDVLQADENAAINVLARLTDSEIKRFMPYHEVKKILLSRSPSGYCSDKGLELQLPSYQPSADKNPYAQLCARK